MGESQVDEGGDLADLCCDPITTNNNAFEAEEIEDNTKDPWEYQ
jgi:hypothetical protein